MSTHEVDAPATTEPDEAQPETVLPAMVDAAPEPPIVGVVMGSKSDLVVMREATALLRAFGVPFEARVVSAHRTPDWMAEYGRTAESRGIEVLIAGAGGAAHLPGMLAAHTVLPVLGVPVPVTALNGLDALLSIVQMPKGVPVATLAVGAPGAANAALLAVSIVSNKRPELRETLRAWRAQRTNEVLGHTTLSEEDELAAGAGAHK